MTAWAPGTSSNSGVAARVQKGWRPRPYHVKMKSTDLAPPRTIDRTGHAVRSLRESEVGRLHLDMVRPPERWTAAPGRADGHALLLLCSNTVAFSMKADDTERHRTTTTTAHVALQCTAVHFRSVHRQLCCLSRRRARQTGVCNRVPVIRSGCQCGSSTHGDGQTDRSAQGNKNPPSKGVQLQLHRSLLGGLPLVGPLGGLPEATQTAAQSRSLGVRTPDLDHPERRDAGQDASASDPLHSDERKSLVVPRFPVTSYQPTK